MLVLVHINQFEVLFLLLFQLIIANIYIAVFLFSLFMADTGIFATTAEIQRKAGANCSSTSNAEAYTNDFIHQTESLINSICRYNFSDNYAALNADVKGLLKEVASNLAAIYCIQYDMSGFTTRGEAENMVNILRDAGLRGLSILRDKKTQDFINNA